jgi:hypothetical protein
MCLEKRIIVTNTAQIIALDSSNNTLDALPTTWTWIIISELRHQALHPTENSPTHISVRRTMGPICVPFRQPTEQSWNAKNQVIHAQPLTSLKTIKTP